MEGLGFLSWGNWTEAYDVSTNGEIIVGLGGDFLGDWEAVIWTESSGMQSVGEVFALDIGVLPDGWIPQVAAGITPDGKYVVGEGLNPNGELEAWLAFLGDPVACMGDFNGDGVRDLADLSTLLASYGLDAGGDLDGDGDTDLSDLSALLGVYGRPCWQ
jgi:hypothetical protein